MAIFRSTITARSARNGHIGSFKLEKKTLLIGDKIWIANAERDDDRIALTTLKPFHRIHGRINILRVVRGKYFAQPPHDQSALCAMRRDDSNTSVPEIVCGISAMIGADHLAVCVLLVVERSLKCKKDLLYYAANEVGFENVGLARFAVRISNRYTDLSPMSNKKWCAC
jgi:hypothetical protein